jgi:hypothetical protein
MMRAEKRFFFSIYHFFQNGNYFGTLKASPLKPKAHFIAEEGTFTFLRENFMSGSYFCMLQTGYRAKADKPNGIGSSYIVRYRSISYFLKPGAAFEESLELNYDVFESDIKIGSIYQNPTRFHINIDIEDKIPLTIQVFIFWLSYRAWAGVRGWSQLPIAGRIAR